MTSRWDARLLTPERAISLVVDWPLVIDSGLAELSQFEPEGGGPRQADQAQVNLRCWQPIAGNGRCLQSVALLAINGNAMEVTTGDLVSAVLRHAVMAHDVPLSGAGGATDGTG